MNSDALALLERLVAFDTTSRHSNLALIEWVEAELARHGIAARRAASEDGTKANLYASIGPAAEGGVVLSGHTDVVPVDGQPWTTDPWVLTERDGRLHGRGTCDMKGFLALALAAVPRLAAAPLARPVHLAFSYDEEVGCLGAPAMIERLAAELPPAQLVVVGEPTSMEVVRGHKGIASWIVTVAGHEAHSSLPDAGASAIMAAIPLLASLRVLAERLAREADPASPFHPPHATLTVGQLNGGTAVNILARECVFAFDFRAPPGMDPRLVLQPFFAEVAALDADLKARFPEAGVTIVNRSLTPAFAPEPDGAAERLARRLAGDNGPPRTVSYGSEAGQFQQAGFSTILCGPGSIEQAHQPDEYVTLAQMERGALFMERLIEAMR